MRQQEASETVGTDVSDVSPQDRPRGDTEVMVERVFAELLEVAGLPRTTSVFDLGLNSVWVTVACARLEQLTGVRVRFTQIFRTPTVAQLAAWIDTARGGSAGDRPLPGRSSAAEGDQLVAITPVQAETVPQKIVAEFSWWFDGPIDAVALERAATDAHRRHQALHARYLDGPELGLAEVPADPGQAEFHHLSEQAGDEAAIEALRQTLRMPLPIEQGKVWRCALARSGRRTLFGVALDHSGFDGRSWGILTAELSAAYAARLAGNPPQWPGRTASLAEMACDFRHQLASADIEKQRQYWHDELRDLPACRLPARSDGSAQIPPMPDNSRYSLPGPAVMRSFLVSQKQLQPWDEYARVHGMPPSVGIAAVYQESLIRAGAAPDFAVMVPIANNSGDVIDRTITNRVGTILLRPNGPSHSGPHLLERTREAYRQAMAARDVLIVPEELGAALSGPEKLIQLDRVVSLNYNATPELKLGDITGTLIAEGAALATKCSFPVMLIISPTPEGQDIGLQVRTDMHDATLADDIEEHFVNIIDNGPEGLEQQTT
ncbi:aryl carrier-like protein [Micromonospora profundi]|uniref:condensation domain-containing protein n=1 Tax=Micromonospora profundi TaxID=1420889 RepID=UPI00143B85CA|nr:condensation domain-containing protein [Micromonospora profundi]NJC11443.1 aryl carrier-like protein [Micromonospora profundi]